MRLFLVDRVEQVTVLDNRFEIPEDFSAGDLTGSAFGLIDEEQQTIKVRFGSEIGHLIRERTWHPSQELIEESDGSLLLTFEASGEKEILAWLYSYLPYVQILEPVGLQEKFLQSLQKAIQEQPAS